MSTLIARQESFEDGVHFKSVQTTYEYNDVVYPTFAPFRLQSNPNASSTGEESNGFFDARFSSMKTNTNSSTQTKNGYHAAGINAGWSNRTSRLVCNRIHLRFMGGKHPGSNLYGMHSSSVDEVHLQLAGSKSFSYHIGDTGRLPLEVSLVSASFGAGNSQDPDEWPSNNNAYSQKSITRDDYGSCWGTQSWNGTYVENSDGYQDQHDYLDDGTYRGRTLYADDSIEWSNETRNILTNESDVKKFQNKFVLNRKGIDALVNSRWFNVQVIDTHADLAGSSSFWTTSNSNKNTGVFYYSSAWTAGVVGNSTEYPNMYWSVNSNNAEELALGEKNSREENGVRVSSGERTSYLTVYGDPQPMGTLKIDGGTVKIHDSFNGVFDWKDKEKVYRNLNDDDLIEGFK